MCLGPKAKRARTPECSKSDKINVHQSEKSNGNGYNNVNEAYDDISDASFISSSSMSTDRTTTAKNEPLAPAERSPYSCRSDSASHFMSSDRAIMVRNEAVSASVERSSYSSRSDSSSFWSEASSSGSLKHGLDDLMLSMGKGVTIAPSCQFALSRCDLKPVYGSRWATVYINMCVSGCVEPVYRNR